MVSPKKYLKSWLERKYKLETGVLVKDIGDGFSSVEDPGIVIELFPDRYEYRHPLFLGLLKINIDGILVRWLDKKGTTHVYPACCVKALEVSDERAEQLRTSAEERFDKPKEPPLDPLEQEFEKQMEIFDTLGFPLEDDSTEAQVAPSPEPEPEKPSLNKMQEKLREVERIIKERNNEGEEE